MQVLHLARRFKLNFITLTTVAKTLAILHRPEVRDTVEGLFLAKHVPSCDASYRPPPATAKNNSTKGLAKNVVHNVEYGVHRDVIRSVHITPLLTAITDRGCGQSANVQCWSLH